MLTAFRSFISSWSLIPSDTTSLSEYFKSKAFRLRVLNAATVGLGVAISLCFIMIPDLSAIFTRGQWITLTVVFVFTPSSGATVRESRDRLLGIFIGTSYAFIALLIMRYIVGVNTTTTSPVAIIVFTVFFVVVVFILMQDSLKLAGSSSYAVILMLYNLPPAIADQSTVIVANFLNTFIGAVIVTFVSSWSFWISASRSQLFEGLDESCCALSKALSTCIVRVAEFDEMTPEETAQSSTLTASLFQLEQSFQRMSAIILDLAVEPTLWRPVVDLELHGAIQKTLRLIQQQLLWLDMSTVGFTMDRQETLQSGLLDSAALPIVLALKSEIGDALLEVGTLLHLARHPARPMDIGWRPEGIALAAEKLLTIGMKRTFLDVVFDLDHSDLVETRQLISFSGTIFALEHLSISVSRLWIDVFQLCSASRRSSIFYAKN